MILISNELYHHGILGMKWGVRRYQNEDGTLTEAGKKRYLNSVSSKRNRYDRAADAAQRDVNDLRKHGYHKEADAVQKVADKNRQKANTVVSREYKKLSDAVNAELDKNSSKIYAKAYNKAADAMNDGGIKNFNAEQEKKYGKDYTKRSGYIDDYNTMFNRVVEQNLKEELNSFYKKNPNIQKAQALVEKYNMTEWDEFAKQNSDAIAELIKDKG